MPPSTWSLFRALAWLRWRLLLNTITHSGSRDFMERLSRAAESILPIAILVVMTPAALGLGAAGAWCGYALAIDDPASDVLANIIRWTLAAVLGMTLVSPLIFSAGQQGSGIVRLLLLPIPSHVLYASHTLGALGDPWIVLSLPMTFGVAAGLIAGGAAGAGLIAAAAAFLMLAVLLGTAALVSAILQLITRNRRRAELFVLGGTLLVIVVSLVPSALLEERHGAREEAVSSASPAGRDEVPIELPRWASGFARAIPSEAYTLAVQSFDVGTPSTTLLMLLVLVGWTAWTHGLTWFLYQRILQTPATTGRARRASAERAFGARLPGTRPAVSAVAMTFARLAFRTPRGRTLVLAPILMLLVFTVLTVWRGISIPVGPARIGGGFSLALFGIAVAVMSLGPFMFNQFAVDRSGLTLEMLAPLGLRDLLYGKALGGALIAIGPVATSFAAGIFTGERAPLLWTTLIAGTVSVYLPFAVMSAILSLMFPRTVDLASIGQASNAHQAAGFIGTLGLAFLAAPPSILAAAGLGVWNSQPVALALVSAWLLVSIGLAWVGFRISERLLENRRENLLMVAVGR